MGYDAVERSRQFALIVRAIDFIRVHARRQPTLEELAQAVHVSPYHLQRQFVDWAGISPKRFLQYLTKEYVRQQLVLSANVLTVADQAGLSSPSRLHDLMVSCEAMTPGEIKLAGRGLQIGYGFAPSPFGLVMVAWTARGVCHFAFCDADEGVMAAELVSLWPHAALERDDRQAADLLGRIFPETPTRGRVHLVLRGTNFQIKVWEALIHTDFGRVISYQQLAGNIGASRAQRAVGSALAANHIGFLIPCHRVIRGNGDVGSYRWGAERKLAMLGWEASHLPRQAEE
jgi:AraC family transcriptional regulator, regulatory protein of adaptative response / methylated-DNA-[protein]-cysteine methyltransferase